MQQRGFTLIEIVVAVAVIATVAAIGVMALRNRAPGGVSAEAQRGKELLLGVRDQAVAQLQCRRIEQATPGAGNHALNVFQDVDCDPATTVGDPLVQTLAFDPALVTSVEVVDNGNFDDEAIQYRADGSLFDTETTGVELTDAAGSRRLNIQLATGSVVIE